MKIKVIILIIMASISIHAMEKQKPEKMESEAGPVKAGAKRAAEVQEVIEPSLLDILPPELQMQILEYITGKTINEAIKGIKRFYVASPESRKSVVINKAILSYLIQHFSLEKKQLQQVVNNLKVFPAFKDPAMLEWIEQSNKRLDEGALRDAAFEGNVKKVEELIKQNVNINSRDYHGHSTALLRAALHNKTSTALILIEHGADVNAQSYSGRTALCYAANNGNVDIVKALLKKGADPDLLVNPKSRYAGITPLIETARRLENNPHNFPIHKYLKAKEIIEELLRAKADPSRRDKGGKTAADYIRRNERLSDEQKTELLQLIEKYSKKNQS